MNNEGGTVKKVKVRIAVVVDEDGDWRAEGDSLTDDQYWVEAELSIPEAKTVEGRVVKS